VCVCMDAEWLVKLVSDPLCIIDKIK
jgi:hypothetical protein